MTFGTPPTTTATRVNDGFADEAATPPSPAMNSRRRIRHLLSPHRAQPIAAGAAERVPAPFRSTKKNAIGVKSFTQESFRRRLW
jgi:hypothetical protein